MLLNNQICLTYIDMCCLHWFPFKTDPATKQLAKQLIIQGAMEQDTENETENEELPGIFFFNSKFTPHWKFWNPLPTCVVPDFDVQISTGLCNKINSTILNF